MKYERLTTEKQYGCGLCNDRKCKKPNLFCKDRLDCKIYNRLAELEDKIEPGTLIELKNRKPLIWGKDGDTVHCQHCGEDLMGVFYGETEVIQCPKCGGFVDSLVAEDYDEKILKDLQNG